MTTSTASRPARRRALILALAAALALPLAAAGQDFTRYVALGDSLTAGVSSSGLIDEVQVNSYPALIARQAAAGSGPFEQPLVGPPGAPPLLDLVSLRPLVIAPRAPQSQSGPPINLNVPRPYDNLGLPGCRTRDLLLPPSQIPSLTCLTAAGLVLRPPLFGDTSAVQQALALAPTFATLWVGNNDVLAAATSGIVIEGVTLTPVAQFEADYRAIVGAVRGAGAEMALATIPNVTAIPFVTTLPPVVVNPATGQPVLVGGQPVPLIGPNGNLAPTDRVLLSASAPLSQGIGIPTALGGTGQPLGTQFFLDAAEVSAITARVGAFNDLIRAVAQEAGAALVDINASFDRLATEGVSIGGIEYSADFLTGGVVSYDGVHATPFGYAFVANEFIAAINEHFDGDVPPVDLFPFTFGPEASAGTFTAADAKTAVFRAAAYEGLRQAVGTPRTGYLLRLLGDGGGPNNPGEPPQPPRPGNPERPDGPRRPRVK